MICEIALDAATKQLLDQTQTVSRDYKVLIRRKCKGDKPALLPMRTDQKFTPSGDNDPRNVNRERNEDTAPKLYQEFLKQQKEYQEKKLQEQAEKKRIVELASHDFEVTEEQPKEDEKEVQSITRPKYQILHSYGFELTSFIAQGPVEEHKRPKELVIKIELPRVNKISEVDLDVSEKSLVLKVKDKYYLDITLPFKVNGDEGAAKFDSKTKTLKVTVPTVKEDNPQQNLPKREPVQENGNTEEEVTEAKSNDQANGKTEEVIEVKANGPAKENTEEEIIEVKPNGKQAENENTDNTEEDNGPQSSLKFVTEESQRKYREGKIITTKKSNWHRN